MIIGDIIYDYLVLGTGISGLQSLEILTKASQKVLGLQAQNYAAGRVYTQSVANLPGATSLKWMNQIKQKLSNVFVEKGATWIEDRHKCLLQLCKNFGLQLREQTTQGENIFLYKGTPMLSQSILKSPQGSEIKNFIKQVEHLSHLYNKYVLSPYPDKLKSSRMLTEYDTKTVNEFLQQNIHSQLVRDLAQNFFQHTQCASCDENSMHEVLTKTARSNDIGILREFIGEYVDEHEPSYILNGGTSVIINSFITFIEKQTHKKLTDIVRFNERVLTVDNKRDDICIVTTINTKTSQVSKFKCKKVICTIPLAVSRQIIFTDISKSKRYIFDNQLRTTCMKSFLIVKKPFWRRFASGDAIFSSEHLVNMCHDISPFDLSCGIMVFFHSGKKFDTWQSRFKNEKNQYQAKRQYIIDLTCKLYSVTEQQKKQYLEDCLFYISTFMDNPSIRSGFQSCTSPGTFSTIAKIGDGVEAFYQDEKNIVFVGSEYSSEYASYMQGAVRVARQKCFKLIGKKDDLFGPQPKQSSKNQLIRPKL